MRHVDHTVGSLVPPVLEAYARVFHPAALRGQDGSDVQVGWAQVAQPTSARRTPGWAMRLLTGPLPDAARVSMKTEPLWQSPSLWWPADRTWCVATDVNLSQSGTESPAHEPRTGDSVPL